jgi:hypothetical protein
LPNAKPHVGSNDHMLIPLDIVWPAMAMQGNPLYWGGIAAGLVIEWPFVTMITGRSWVDSTIPTVTMNLVSSVIGFVAMPALGAFWEIGPGDLLDKRLGLPTFNPVSWSVTALIAVVVNVLVEGTILSRLFHAKVSKRNLGLLVAANVLSVAVAFGAVFLGDHSK